MTTTSRLELCLLCETPLVETAVRLAAGEADLRVFPIEGALTTGNTLSAEGMRIVDEAAAADAVLIEWAFARAPELNTICFHIRRSVRVPVFMVTGGGVDSHIAAIAAGADDALSFPLEPGLIRARILSYHRLVRAARESALAEQNDGGNGRTGAAHDVVRFGALSLDRTAHRFFIHDAEVELTPREHALLSYLIEHNGELCTRDSILDNVWGINFDTGTNMVDVYMYFLRKKLEGHGLSAMIETVRGRGYRLSE